MCCITKQILPLFQPTVVLVGIIFILERYGIITWVNACQGFAPGYLKICMYSRPSEARTLMAPLSQLFRSRS